MAESMTGIWVTRKQERKRVSFLSEAGEGEDERDECTDVLEVVVLDHPETTVAVSDNPDLLVVHGLIDVGPAGKLEQRPGRRGRRRVLAGHEEGNHDVGNLEVRQRSAVLVRLVLEGRDHVVLVLGTEEWPKHRWSDSIGRDAME